MEKRNLVGLILVILAVVLIVGIYGRSSTTGKLGYGLPEDEMVLDRLQGSEIEERQEFTMNTQQQLIVENFIKNLDLVKITVIEIDKSEGVVYLGVEYGDFSVEEKIKENYGKAFDLDGDGNSDLDISIDDILSPGMIGISIQAV